MPTSDGDDILNGLVTLWLEKIRRAKEYKKKAFQDDADEAMGFFKPPDGNYNSMYKGDINSSKGVGIDVPEPSMKMTLNKVTEVVQIFAPLLYAKNPVRQVNPRAPADLPPSAIPDPLLWQSLMLQEQARAQEDALKSALLSAYLNWTPNENGLKDDAEKAIDEALIKGRGCIWTGLVTPPGGTIKVVASTYDSVDFLQIDPDAESLEDAWWIARECCHPVWEVERKYGLRPGSLKGNRESYGMQAEVDATRSEYDRQRGMTNDLMVYHEIWSRMGCGGRLRGSDNQDDPLRRYMNPGDLAGFAATLDPIAGDHVYLVVAPDVPYPLNLPPEVQALPIAGDGSPGDGLAAVKAKLAWPIPYWVDRGWPVSVLDFHPVPRCAWPMSHIKPAMGELRFLCWAYSFVAGKIKNTLRDVIVILKEMSEQFKLQVLEGADLSMVELEPNNARNINEIVQVLQFPQMNRDIWLIIEAVEANFDKRVGLNEVFYGMKTTQDRSATESQLKSQSMNIRPDDMAQRVETWMTMVARKEAVAARLTLAPADVLPILGPTLAALWGLHVSSNDLSVFRELEYRIEAGSTQKPNRDRDVANNEKAMQVLMPIFNQFAQGTGQLGPINALIAQFCKTLDIPPGPMMLPAAPPPPMAPPGGEGPPPPEGEEGPPP